MKNVLVFPCGSEIGLEIFRSLAGDRHFHLVGGASTQDHGRFVFHDVVGDLPWISAPDFSDRLRRIVLERKIDLIYPAMDMAIAVLKRAEPELGCPVVSAPLETVEMCLSKRRTYERLYGVVKTPKLFEPHDRLTYPVFAKPDIGYGSRGAVRLDSDEDRKYWLGRNPDLLLLEYLNGAEYTVDCFTDRHGQLLFSGARVRGRTMNGISVYTCPVSAEEQAEFTEIAHKINSAVKMRGAWFVQLKRDKDGALTLMEVAARLGGSSGLYRGLGVNFALLSLWDALDHDVAVLPNGHSIEMDRALDNVYKLGLSYNEVFLDYDDTIVLADGQVNPRVMGMVFSCLNRGVKVTVLSRHRGDLEADMKKHRLSGIFSRVLHIPEDADKGDYIDNGNAIFVDDSFAERMRVRQKAGIPVFGLDMIEALA